MGKYQSDKGKDKSKDSKKKKGKGGHKPFNKKGAKNEPERKAQIPLTQRDKKRYTTKKIAIVFNEEERRQYMAGFYGAKKKRKEEYLEKKKIKQKRIYKDHRKEVKKVKEQQFERYRQIIEDNDKNLEQMQLGLGFQKEKKEILTTENDNQVEVVTEFL